MDRDAMNSWSYLRDFWLKKILLREYMTFTVSDDLYYAATGNDDEIV